MMLSDSSRESSVMKSLTSNSVMVKLTFSGLDVERMTETCGSYVSDKIPRSQNVLATFLYLKVDCDGCEVLSF